METKQVITADVDIKTTQILRRYMDLPKLLDLLHSRELYMRRGDGFTDRLEGALFPTLRASLNQAHAKGQTEYNADQYYSRARKGTYLSCWTISGDDSMALWQLYGGGNKAVAVTATVDGLLQAAFPWGAGIHLYKVKYVDHVKTDTYTIGRQSDVFQYKHKAFEYEKELRLVVPRLGSNWEQNTIGLRLPISNMNALIRSIVVAPEAEDEYYKAIKDLCTKYGITSPVRRSKLTFVPT